MYDNGGARTELILVESMNENDWLKGREDAVAVDRGGLE